MIVLPKTREIDNSLIQFLSTYNLFPDVMLDTDFSYYPDEQLVTYAFVVTTKHEEWFREYLKTKKHFDYWNNDLWLVNFFHEVGHYVTIDDFSKKELDAYYEQRAINGNDKKAYFKYFASPVEDAATSWAIEFIEAHDTEIADWWNNDLAPKINKYFIACGLDTSAD